MKTNDPKLIKAQDPVPTGHADETIDGVTTDVSDDGAIAPGQTRPQVNPEPDTDGRPVLLAGMARSGRRPVNMAGVAVAPTGDASQGDVPREGGEAGGMATRSGSATPRN